MPVLSVSSFGGGVVLVGSSDAQRTDELRAADSYDIGPRGQLIATSDKSAFTTSVKEPTQTNALTQLYGMDVAQVPQGSFLVFVGDYSTNTYIAVVSLGSTITATSSAGAILVGGVTTTFATFPFVGPDNKQKRVTLVCIGARSGQFPSQAAGVYAIVYDPTGASYTVLPIINWDVLGTGPIGEYFMGTGLTGNQSAQMYARGIIAYNNFAFAWGWDVHDHAGPSNQDGPNRLMFSNVGNPLKWGLDPQTSAIAGGAAETNRSFQDSDAFTIGGAGEVIRAACVWAGKLWIGTNAGLHYVEGFGRESFLTNGAIPVRQTRNVIGPHALVEGPDGLLHGVSDEGHWIFDGGNVDTPYRRLRDFADRSKGYWDLIWSDSSQATGFPGKTNQDLVWMLSVPELMQVWIVIPFCSIANGYGQGTDTVILKYHCTTGGYTRQNFPGVTFTHGELYRRDQTGAVQTFLCAPGLATNIQRYGFRTGAGSPVMCAALPDVSLGEYAPHGPDGVGVMRKVYLTVSWESAASLPLVFSVTPSIDGETAASPTVFTINSAAPGSPADGDLWLDTSGTDTNLGNGTAGSFTPAHPADYILKRWVATWAKWVYTTIGGQQGTRATVAIAYIPQIGTRVLVRVQCTAASGRFQLEGLGLDPATIRSDR
jgi:hypothetical protein